MTLYITVSIAIDYSELDEETEKRVLEIFEYYQNKGVKFLIATHSNVVSNACETEYHISDYKLKLYKAYGKILKT